MAKQLSTLQPLGVGINNVGSYQVSGRPYASHHINVGPATEIAFPMVTQYYEIINHGSGSLRVGYSQVGVSGSNYFVVPSASAGMGPGRSGVQRVKVSSIWIYCGKAADGDGGGNLTDISITAGLTNIDRRYTAGRLGPSWSGSAGVG